MFIDNTVIRRNCDARVSFKASSKLQYYNFPCRQI